MIRVNKKKEAVVLLIFALIFLSIAQYIGIKKEFDALPWRSVSADSGSNLENTKGQTDNSNQIIGEIEQDVRDNEVLTLSAVSACLMDADNGRVLYEKDGYSEKAMASTTKIMTLIVILENAQLDDIVTVSSNASKQPDVQLNIITGEQYRLGDLVYSLMLESHNDVAVALAEHVGGSVETFCNMMTEKARAIGALHTQFKTPNGLDAEGHYTTASDLALISCYALKNQKFREIITQQTYEFKELTKGRSFTVNNKNRFLYLMKGAIGIKTGYTSKAGYCFVGALESEGRTYVSVVLGSGWPPHKQYKWADTQKLMNYGMQNFTFKNVQNELLEEQPEFSVPQSIPVKEGEKKEVTIYAESPILNESILMSETENVRAVVNITDEMEAPVVEGQKVGKVSYYIDNNVYKEVPIYTAESVRKVTFPFAIKELLHIW
ncbi:MAG: D-alanyl-D-alanine carboxypeptidase [Lachnospiraceae bacterium]|nr:D-alanyl-D-alanine carboxypeptidase [Lachnospiraceae bacterium]